MSVCCYYLCLSVLQCSFSVCGCCVRELTGAAAARIELIPFRVSHNSMKYTTYLQGALGVWQQPLSLIFLLFVCVSVYYSLSHTHSLTYHFLPAQWIYCIFTSLSSV